MQFFKKPSFLPLFNAKQFASSLVGKNYKLPSGETLVQSLLSLTRHPCIGPVKQIDNQMLMDSKENILDAFEYIIITSREADIRHKDLADKYPWVRIIHRSCLSKLIPKYIVDTLPQ